jgi:hypothetical protein
VRRQIAELVGEPPATDPNSVIHAVEWLTKPDCESYVGSADWLINRVDRVVVDPERDEVLVTGVASPHLSGRDRPNAVEFER